MYKTLLVVVVGLALSGCAITRDGVQLGGGPSASDVQNARNQLVKNAESTTAKKVAEGVLTSEAKAGVLVVGNVGPLRELDEQEHHKLYKSYSEAAAIWHPEKPTVLSESEFVANYGGWTSVETFSIPGLIHRRTKALVLKRDVDTVSFASTFGSVMVGTTGDLVGVRANDDGLGVIDKLLCKESEADYRTCASQFERGRFDQSSGLELDQDFKPKSNGVQIDTITYKVIRPDGEAASLR